MQIWFLLKILITLPVFLWFWLKLKRKAKNKRKGKEFNEENLYRWTKSYAAYFLWLKGYKTEVINLNLWNEKSNFIVLNKYNDHPLLLLALMKINKFENNAPLSFLTNAKIWNCLPIEIKNFYSLINHYIWTNEEKTKENIVIQSIENIQTPRSFVILFQPLKNDWEKISKITYGGFANTLFLKVKLNQNKIQIIFEKKISSLQLPQMNKKFYIQKIQKWNSQI